MFQHYDAEGGDGATFKAVYSDGLNTVRVTGRPGNKAAEKAAGVAALTSLYPSSPKRRYLVQFIANGATLFDGLYNLNEAFRTGGGTIGELRAALLAAYNNALTLPATFTTEFQAEITAKGTGLAAIANNSTWTQLQCSAWQDFLNGWYGKAIGLTAFAAAANQLDAS